MIFKISGVIILLMVIAILAMILTVLVQAVIREFGWGRKRSRR